MSKGVRTGVSEHSEARSDVVGQSAALRRCVATGSRLVVAARGVLRQSAAGVAARAGGWAEETPVVEHKGMPDRVDGFLSLSVCLQPFPVPGTSVMLPGICPASFLPI
jgi:hypothetical protein